MKAEDYVQLWRLARRRLKSEADYEAFQAFQATLLLAHLARFNVEVCDKLVVDLGSGVGGYSRTLAHQGARVVAIDLINPAPPMIARHSPVRANALRVPLRDACVDLVFCASLIEHVSLPELVIAEICRVLAPGGYSYLSFPPFYSPRGGHEFSPLHYLGESFAIRFTPRSRGHPKWAERSYKISERPTSFAQTYDGWGLHKMTIAKARRLIAMSGMRIVDMSTRYFPVSAIRCPVVGELVTWHAQFLLYKPPKHADEG